MNVDNASVEKLIEASFVRFILADCLLICFGNIDNGIEKTKRETPITTKPIHHEPIHRGSFRAIPGFTEQQYFIILIIFEFQQINYSRSRL